MWPYTGNPKRVQRGPKTLLDVRARTLEGRTTPELQIRLKNNLEKEYFNQLDSRLPWSYPYRSDPKGFEERQWKRNKTKTTNGYVITNKPDKCQFFNSQKNSAANGPVFVKDTLIPLNSKEDNSSYRVTENVYLPVLGNDLLNENVRRAIWSEEETMLPPLRRKSLELAKRLEFISKLKTARKRKGTLKGFGSCLKDNDGISLPFVSEHQRASPARFVDVSKTGNNIHIDRYMKYSSMSDNTDFRRDANQKCNRHCGGRRPIRRGELKRKRLFDFSREGTDSSLDQLEGHFKYTKKETVTPDPISGDYKNNFEVDLGVIGKNTDADIMSQLLGNNSMLTNGYQLRQEYSRNLEKKWFKEYLQKSNKAESKVKNGNPVKTDQQMFDLQLDMFYSPEPETDIEDNNFADNEDIFLEDDASMRCGSFSTATAAKARRFRDSIRSTGVIVEGDTASDETSSASDIEIVLKNDELIQRKTKHKMLKKRKRQMERYKLFLPIEITQKQDASSEEEIPLTDHEIRALRLKLQRQKDKIKKLKGKRKFLQVANAVFAAILFKKILLKIRKQKKRLIKKRQQRIATIAKRNQATKRVTWKDTAKEQQELLRIPTPKPTPKERFMIGIGRKLIKDIAGLKLFEDKDSVQQDSNSDQDETETADNTETTSKEGNKWKPMKPSKLEAELKRISARDLSNCSVNMMPQNRIRKRRHSHPHYVHPEEFLLQIEERPRRRNRSRSNRRGRESGKRNVSPVYATCSCSRHWQHDLETRANSVSRPSVRVTSCRQQKQQKAFKTKTIPIPTAQLKRTFSVDKIRSMPCIELRELLKDVDVPAKEIKLQILARKFIRQRRKRNQIRLSPCRLPEIPVQVSDTEESKEKGDSKSEESDDSDYNMVYGSPFVSSGVMWNQKTKQKAQSWKAEDVEKEANRITRMLNDVRLCRYIRLDSFNQAVIDKLN